MRVQGDMVLLKPSEHRTRNAFRMAASNIWPDAKPGDFYTAETHLVDGGESVLVFVRRCSPNAVGARKVNVEGRIWFAVPKSIRERIEKPRNRGGHLQKNIFGEVVK